MPEPVGPTGPLALNADRVNQLLNAEAQGHTAEMQPAIDRLRSLGHLPPAMPKIPNPGGYNPKFPVSRTEEPPSVGGFAANAGYSGLNFLKDTAQGIGGIAAAPFQLAGSLWKDPAGTVAAGKQMIQQAPQMGKNFLKYEKDRYGGAEPLAHTLYTDPFGVAADAATVLTAGEMATTKLPAVSKALGTAARYSDPLSMLRIPHAPKKAGKMMTEALAPSEELMAKVPNIAEEALKRGTSVSAKGAAAGQAHIDAIVNSIAQRTDEVDSLFQQTGVGHDVRTDNVLTSPKVMDEHTKARKQVAPGPDIDAARGVVEGFYNTHGSVEVPNIQQVPKQVSTGVLDAKGNPIMKTVMEDVHSIDRVTRDIPIPEGRELISGEYKHRSPAWDAPNAMHTANDMAKAVASSMLDEIIDTEDMLVQAGHLDRGLLREAGQEASIRIDIQKALEKAIRAEDKSSKGFLSTMMGSMGTAGVATSLGHPKVAGTALGFGALKSIMQRKDVQTAIANALYRGNRILPNATTAVTRVAQGVQDSVSETTRPSAGIPRPPTTTPGRAATKPR